MTLLQNSVTPKTFTPLNKYETYNNYSDSITSIIDEDRNIILDQNQELWSEESNSQYICFEMPRYFDGIDFTTMTISIHIVNKCGNEFTTMPVNVSYSDTRIRFSWLVDETISTISGEVSFEIVVYGYNEKNQKYIWKSKPNGKLKINKSLSGNGIVPETYPGYLDFLLEINIKAEEAKDAARRAEYASATLGKKDIVATSTEIKTFLDL